MVSFFLGFVTCYATIVTLWVLMNERARQRREGFNAHPSQSRW
jgi:hypothetical protein